MAPADPRPARPSPGRNRLPRLIGRGEEAEVWEVPGTNAVRKRFFWKPGTPERILREATALRALHESVPSGGVRFPALVRVDTAAGELDMERAGGRTLLDWARDGLAPGWSTARGMADGLLRIERLFHRPFHDFGAVNVLWDPDTDRVWFIDLASEPLVPTAGTRSKRLAQSLGYFLGVAIYETARPGLKRRIRTARRLLHSFRAMRSAVPRSVPLGTLWATAWAQFSDAAFRGSPARRIWYATFGLAWALAMAFRASVPR